MSVWQQWMQHPERVWVRKCLFYIHLWVGAGVGLYIVLMSITGSLIVYRNELERVPSLVPPSSGSSIFTRTYCSEGMAVS